MAAAQGPLAKKNLAALAQLQKIPTVWTGFDGFEKVRVRAHREESVGTSVEGLHQEPASDAVCAPRPAGIIFISGIRLADRELVKIRPCSRRLASTRIGARGETRGPSVSRHVKVRLFDRRGT